MSAHPNNISSKPDSMDKRPLNWDNIDRINKIIIYELLAIILVAFFEYLYLQTNLLSQWQILHELCLDIIQEILIAIVVALILTITFEPQTRNVINAASEKSISEMKENTDKTIDNAFEQVTKKTEKSISEIKGNTDKAINNAVEQVTKKTIDHMLSDFSGNRNIYKELKAFVFDQPFIKSNFYLYLWIKWLEENSNINKGFVHKHRITSYEVTNPSRKVHIHKIRAFEDTIQEFIGYTKINSIKVCPKNLAGLIKTNNLESVHEENFFCSSISDFNRDSDLQNEKCLVLSDQEDIGKISQFREDGNLHLDFDLKINPGKTMIIEVDMEAVSKSDYEYTFVMMQVTDGMDLEIVHHPSDLDVKVQRLHPNRDKFREIVCLPHHKHYKIDTGILPFQGMLIRWTAFK